MKYTKSLSRLNNIADMKIANEMSELDKLAKKKLELEELILKLQNEIENGKIELQNLINRNLSKIADYYKIRSSIAALSGQILILETRINSANDNIEEIMNDMKKVNEVISQLRRKKKKFEKLMSEGL